MAKATYSNLVEGSSPAWVGDELVERAAVMEVGGLLQASAFPLNEDGGTRRFVESGTVVGRTYAERDAGTGFGPVALDGSNNITDNEVYLLLHDVYDVDEDASATFYRPGRLVYERWLPAATRTSAGLLGAVRRFYQTRRGPK